MVTEPTGRSRGRPEWDLSKDDDRYLVASFWATQIVESKFRGATKATRHATAMTYAAIERGRLIGSRDNLAALSRSEGKLEFQTVISTSQFISRPEAHDIKKRADDIRRRARWAMQSNYEWTAAMAAAFAVAYYAPERENALTLARLNCLAVSEMAFFEQSLQPFIIGRFDPSKRVVFSLPDFMPNFL